MIVVLDETEWRTLTAVQRLKEELGYPPSVREVCRLAGFRSSATGQKYLSRLARKGVLERSGRSRSIVLARGAHVVKEEE